MKFTGVSSSWKPWVMFIAAMFISLTGCIRSGKQGSGSGLSAFVEVQGMDPGDENLAGIKYELICKKTSTDSTERRIAGSRPNPSQAAEFPDGEIIVGESCALEVSADKEQPSRGPVVWLAYRNNVPVEGVFYRSNFAQVTLYAEQGAQAKKYLQIALTKTYRTRYADEFPLVVQLKFEVEAKANLPKEAGLQASLRCYPKGAQNNTFQESTNEISTKKPYPDDIRAFVFRASEGKMRAAVCDEVRVAVNGVPMYVGSLSQLEFANATKAVEMEIGPFSVRNAQERFGDVACDDRDGASKCIAARINQPTPVWFAVLHARVDSNEIDVVLTHKDGLVANSGSVIAADFKDLSRYKYYNLDARNIILGKPYNLDGPDGLNTALAGKEYALPGNFQPLYLVEVYNHGFKTVSEGDLNGRTDARWFADVQASRGNENRRLLVGGGQKYFYTAASNKVAVPGFFTADAYRANLAPSDNTFRSYAVAGGSLPGMNCSMNLDYVRNDLGSKTLSVLVAQGDAQLNSCEVNNPTVLQFLADRSWTITPRFYVWDWHKTSF